MLAALKSAGIRDRRAHGLRLLRQSTRDVVGRPRPPKTRLRRAKSMTVACSASPRKKLLHRQIVPRQNEEWLRDHPDRWQTREEFVRDLQARARTDVAAEPTDAALDAVGNEVPTGGEYDGLLLVAG